MLKKCLKLPLIPIRKSSMHNPAMYEMFNLFQKRDSLYCLQKFGDQMRWRENASVIDLGSGDGFVTANFLKSVLPESFEKLVGVDVSKEMVDYANKKYGNAKIFFDLMNVVGGEVPKKYRGAFDHAFSSYLFQFVSQKQAFQNIYNVLKESGSFVLVFSNRIPALQAYNQLSKKEKWQKYVGKELFNTKYHQLQNTKTQEQEYRKLMTECGFKNIQVEVETTVYEYGDKDDLFNMIQAANLLHVPEGPLLAEFMEEYRQVLKVDKVENKPKGCSMTYDRIVALGHK